MRIRELVGYKAKPEYAAVKDSYGISELKQKLEYLGYKKYFLGAGVFGTVYARPEDDFVIKIFQPDRGYRRYLDYMRSNLQNPYVPKLRGKPLKLPNEFTLVRIEKLREIDPKLYSEISQLRFARDDAMTHELRKNFEQRYPQFLNFLEELKLIGSRGSGIALDLHSGNIMQRGNLPVVTDPFVG